MAPGGADVVPVSGEGAEGLAEAVFEFMEEIRPKGGVLGPGLRVAPPPYEHRLGVTHGPAFTVRGLVPRWEPPESPWPRPLPVEPPPPKGRPQEVPEAFRRR
jgi:hypothetical protein